MPKYVTKKEDNFLSADNSYTRTKNQSEFNSKNYSAVLKFCKPWCCFVYKHSFGVRHLKFMSWTFCGVYLVLVGVMINGIIFLVVTYCDLYNVLSTICFSFVMKKKTGNSSSHVLVFIYPKTKREKQCRSYICVLYAQLDSWAWSDMMSFFFMTSLLHPGVEFSWFFMITHRKFDFLW